MGSRRVLGFALSEHHDAALAYGALVMAVAVRGGSVPCPPGSRRGASGGPCQAHNGRQEPEVNWRSIRGAAGGRVSGRSCARRCTHRAGRAVGVPARRNAGAAGRGHIRSSRRASRFTTSTSGTPSRHPARYHRRARRHSGEIPRGRSARRARTPGARHSVCYQVFPATDGIRGQDLRPYARDHPGRNVR